MAAGATPWCHGRMRWMGFALAVVLVACGGDDTSSNEPGSSGAAEAGTSSTSSPASSSTGSSSSTTEVADSTASSSSTGAPSGCTASPEALADCVDIDAYQSDLEFIASLRVPGSTHWQAVQDLCADRLTELGFQVDLFEYGSGVNVLGTLPGSDPDAPHVMIGAHYDHIEECAGADDNATGVAGSLEAARVLAMGQYTNTLTIACWDEEERGLIGSEAFATSAASQGIDVGIYFNFEMIGYASDEPDTQQLPTGFDLIFPEEIAMIEANDSRGDFLFLTGDPGSADAVANLQAQGERVDLPVVALVLNAQQVGNPLFGDLRRSDHAPFWDQGFPAIFITDTGEFRNDRYHCVGGEDSVDSLVPSFTEKVLQASVASAAIALEPIGG